MAFDAATPPQAAAADAFDRLSRPIAVWALAGLLMTAVAALTTDIVRRDYEYARRQAVAANDTSARLLSQNIGHAVQGVASVLEAAALHGEDGERPGAPKPALGWLRAVAAKRPAIAAVKVIDLASGRTLVSTEGEAPAGMPNLLDADAIAAARAQASASDRLRVSRPIRDMSKTFVSFSRTYGRRTADGAQAPAIAIAYVDVDYFQKLFDQLDVGRHGGALVATDDGIILARRPFDASQVGRDIGGARLFAELRTQGPFGSYEVAAITDGVRRAISYRAIPELPLIVTASKAVDDIFETVRFARDRDIGLGAAACAAILALAAFLSLTGRRHRATVKAALRNERFLQSIFDSSADCIKVLDRDGRLLSINRSGLCLLEIDDIVQVRGLDFPGLFPDAAQPQVRRAMALALKGETGRFTAQCPTFKATPKWWDIVVSGVGDADGRPERLIFVSRDITDQVAARDALTAAAAATEAAATAKTRFLSAMSHELRTPLTGILGAADLLEDSLLSSRERELTGLQKEAGRQLLGVISNILDWAKIDAGRIDLASEPVDAVDMVKTCLALVRPAADQKRLRLDFALETSDLGVACDRIRVQQILLNFLSNAVKFTASGQIVTTVGRTAAGRIRFAVHDTGPGIAACKRHLLFQEFSQVGDGAAEGGAGLGLAISRRLAAAMGGEVGVESAVGVGSVFWFEAPFARPQPALGAPAAAPTLVFAAPHPDETGAAAGPRVLLAEDIATNRNLIRAMLETAGFQVDAVGDGAAAVEAAAAQDYALVLMDMQMPVLSGRQATEAIRALPERGDVAILALTANVYPEQIQLCRDAGMDGHLPKPIERQELVRIVREWTAEGRRHVRPEPLRSVA